MRRFLRLVPSLALIPMLWGCPSKTVDSGPAEIVDMEPLFIVLTDKNGKEEVGDFDSQELFDRALRSYEEGRLVEALAMFEMLASEAVTPANKAIGWTHVALCHLGLRNVGSALEALDKAEGLVETTEGKRQASLIRMQALAKQGKWKQVRALGAPLLGAEIPGVVRAQALLLTGLSYKVEGDLVAALKYLEDSSRIFMSEVPFEKQYRNRGLAQALNKTADVYRLLLEKIPLHLPVERMQVDIHDKLAIYRKAETAYQDAARVRDPYWSPRAGYRMGRLREAFAMDILHAEQPTDLSPEEMAEFSADLGKKVTEYLEIARAIYEETIKMVETQGFPEKWKKRSEMRIKAIDQQIQNLAKGAD